MKLFGQIPRNTKPREILESFSLEGLSLPLFSNPSAAIRSWFRSGARGLRPSFGAHISPDAGGSSPRFLLLLRCFRPSYRLACFSVFEAFLEASSLERSSVSGVSPLIMDLRRDGFWRCCRRSRRLGFWRRSLEPLLEFGCAWRRESGLCSNLISGFLDLRSFGL